MLSRLPTAIALALLAVFGTTSAADAAEFSDREKVMIGTAAVAVGLMLVLLVLCIIRRAQGMDCLPPADADLDRHEASLPAKHDSVDGDHATASMSADVHGAPTVPGGSTATHH